MKKTFLLLSCILLASASYASGPSSAGGVTQIIAGDSTIELTPANGRGKVSMKAVSAPAPDTEARVDIATTCAVLSGLSAKVNQGVKTTDSPSFSDVTAGSITVNGTSKAQRFKSYEGGSASTPSFTWAHAINSGMYLDGGILRWAIAGLNHMALSPTQLYVGKPVRGTCAAMTSPGLSFTSDSRTGLCNAAVGYLWTVVDGMVISTTTPRTGAYGVNHGTYTINAGGYFKNGSDMSVDSFPVLFTSTDTSAGCGVYATTVTYRLPVAWTLTGSRMLVNDLAGDMCVVVSTGDTVAGTWVVISSGDAMVNNTMYSSNLTHWATKSSLTIPAGKLIRFYIGGGQTANEYTQSCVYQLDFTR